MQGLQVAARKRALPRSVLLPGLLGVFLLIGAPAPASSDDTTPVSELTGEAVGAALGLDAEPTTGVNCPGLFSEYEDGMGYCLDGTTDDPVEKWVLAQQINGYERTDVVEAYATALVDQQTTDLAGGTAEHAALLRRVLDLLERMHEQGKAD